MMTRLRPLARAALDAVLPPLCLACGAQVAEPGSLCGACWERITYIGPPVCAACGLPFAVDAGPEMLCGACLAEPPPFGRARAVFRYDGASRALVLRFKHADRIEGAPAFARWMARAGAELLKGCDLLVPVPMHRWRLFLRRYNQAAVLAMALGRLSAIPVATGVLIRRRRTPPQGHLGRAERASNVKGAFATASFAPSRLEGRRVVLVDDVLTTGATVGECARVLRKAGAAQVDVLTLGRVVLEG